MKVFSSKVVLVTGSSGLGEATAMEFAKHGATVIIAARRIKQSQQVVQQIHDRGGEAHFIQTDVSRAADIENMVTATMTKYGRLDCAVNNAGIVGPRFTRR